MRQTEEGTPNELNRFLRHDQTGESIEDIKQVDDVYQAALNEIDRMIEEESQQIKNLYNKTNNKTKKEAIQDLIEEHKNDNKKDKIKFQKSNPVLIKPAALPRTDDDKIVTKEAAIKFLNSQKTESKHLTEAKKLATIKQTPKERQKAIQNTIKQAIQKSP